MIGGLIRIENYVMTVDELRSFNQLGASFVMLS